MDAIPYYEILLPAAFIVGGFLIGYFLEKVVLPRLVSLADVTIWKADNVIFPAFRGIPVFWGGALGIYLATVFAAADPGLETRLNNLLVVALLWSVTIVAARIGAGLISIYAGRSGSFLPATSLIPGLIRLSIYITGLLIILQTLDVSITPVLTALGVGGLAVALALQDTLANVFAGVYLLAARQIKPGDYVRLESGEEGYIADINWRSTSVRTILDTMVIVPNGKLASAIVTNFDLPGRDLLLRVPFGVEYDSDLEHVERVTLEVARETLLEVTGRPVHEEPRVFLQSFGEFSLNFIALLRARDYFDQYRVRHVFMKRLLQRYRAEGIAIPFPIREFQMQLSPEGPDAAGPAKVYPPDYHASAVESNAPEGRDEA